MQREYVVCMDFRASEIITNFYQLQKKDNRLIDLVVDEKKKKKEIKRKLKASNGKYFVP